MASPHTFGFSHYEMNFGKYIPHFKVFNDLGPILGNQTYGLQQLYPVYAAMGQARQFSTALRSSNRYYLNQIGGSMQQSIFSVAKYDSANASPALTDVVFAFMNLDRNNDQSGNFDVNITQNSCQPFRDQTRSHLRCAQHRRLHRDRSESPQLFPQSQDGRPIARQRTFRRA